MDAQAKEQMSDSERGQVNRTAAEVYAEFFVPALFAEWTDRVVDAAQVDRGQRVLDVACGTGILARTAAERVGDPGSIVGLDINEGMLSVARKAAPQIEWRQGTAEALPFGDSSFDAVISQFGLMFFEDKVKAIREMRRVLRQNSRLVVAVWDSLENSPGYARMVDLLQRLFGDEAANALRAPFSLGDVSALKALFREAGLPQAQIATYAGTARFPSLESWMYTDIRGWTLADSVDDRQYAQLVQEAKQVLRPFVHEDGSVSFAAPAHIVTVRV